MHKLLKGTITAALTLITLLPLHAQWSWSPAIPRPLPLREKSDTVEMVLIGDVMMHSRQLEYDWRQFFSLMESRLSEPDIAVANMEFTLAGEPFSGYPSFSAPDDYAQYASDCGIDVFLTANNHILDKGREGLKRTLGVYNRMRIDSGVRYTGTAVDSTADEASNPLIVVRKGIRIALINFTYGTNMGTPDGWPRVRYMRREEVGKAISKAKETGADFIVALPHWGNEYELKHSSEQQKWAEWLAGQGVDAIVGAHPHVVQDTTHIAGVPVIYSLGNAVSNMSATNTRLELAVTLRFVSHPDDSKEMLEPTLEFLWCTLPGRLTEGYATIPVADYIGRRDSWLMPSDYDNMISTLERVKTATGIE